MTEREEDTCDVGGRMNTLETLRLTLREQVTYDAREVPLVEGTGYVGLVVGAWRHTTFRQARAVLALLAADLGFEAMVNARSCLEHAVAVQALAVTFESGGAPEAEHHLRLQALAGQDKALKNLEILDTASGETHRELLAGLRQEWGLDSPKKTPAPNIADTFKKLPVGEHIYRQVYAPLSATTHASFLSAAPYLRSVADGQMTVAPAPEAVSWAETMLWLCWSCWAAEDGLSRFVDGTQDEVRRHVELLGRVGLDVS